MHEAKGLYAIGSKLFVPQKGKSQVYFLPKGH
jgi:hypothetical protein